jgi:hypothetical protein
MIRSYFEEFPTLANLAKLNLVKGKTKLYLAAKSFKEFETIVNKIKKSGNGSKVIEYIYWPILDKKEGYWISPFTKRSALKRIFEELKKGKGTKYSVMLDLELPTTKNPWLYVTQMLNFFSNKKMIKRFISSHKGKVYLAEYYPTGKLKEKFMGFIGIHFNDSKVFVIKMIYHSLHDFNKKFITNKLQSGVEEFGDKYLVALGTIAKGINGDEPLLSLKQLKQDLRIAKENGVSEVVIFRLGGLNEKYVGVLNNS